MIVLCFVIKKKQRGPEPVTLQSVELTVVAGATRSPPNPIPIPQELSDADETAEQVLDNASELHHHHDNVAASRDALRKAQLKRAAKAVAASEVDVTGKSAGGAAASKTSAGVSGAQGSAAPGTAAESAVADRKDHEAIAARETTLDGPNEKEEQQQQRVFEAVASPMAVAPGVIGTPLEACNNTESSISLQSSSEESEDMAVEACIVTESSSDELTALESSSEETIALGFLTHDQVIECGYGLPP